jgi:hypothetical protein
MNGCMGVAVIRESLESQKRTGDTVTGRPVANPAVVALGTALSWHTEGAQQSYLLG